MLIPFSDLPNYARVWIYQASRAFCSKEKEKLEQQLQEFLKKWTAHGTDLITGYEIPYDRFIVIGLDEQNQGATGIIKGFFNSELKVLMGASTFCAKTCDC